MGLAGFPRRVGLALVGVCFLFHLAAADTAIDSALKLIEQHRYREAEALLKRMTAQNPADDDAHLILGDLYLRFQAYSAAAAEYNAVVLHDPKNLRGLVGLGEVTRDAGDLPHALAYFKAALRLNPNAPVLHRNLAALYVLLGNSRDAISEYRVLAKLDPRSDAHLQMAELYAREKDFTDAEKFARIYLITHPADGQAWNALAEALFEQGRMDDAWQAAGEAVKALPGNAAVLLTRAKIALSGERRFSTAASDARQILNLDPGNAEAGRILVTANEMIARRRLRVVIGIFAGLVTLTLWVLLTAWRRREKRESEKTKSIEMWARQIESLGNPDEIVEAVFSRVSSIFDLPKGIFFAMNRDETEMQATFTNFKVPLRDPLEVKREDIPSWDDLFRGQAVTAAQAFRMTSFTSVFPDARRAFEKHDIRLLVPLLVKNRLLALLALGGVSRREFRNRIPTIRQNAELGYLFAQRAALILETSTLYELSMLDEQTRIFNKRFFSQMLSDEIKRVERYQQPVSLLMIDIDHFKELNDSFGHPMGDLVLREMANAIRESIRQGMDSVFRYGGEEFTVILPATSSEKAVETAERIRQTIAAHQFSGLPKESHVTISVGVASYPEHADSDWEIIAAADQALYHSKKGGRNRVTLIDRSMIKESPPALANKLGEENEP